jgi:DNA-binding winged helix-turn-helix (wHTH) protein
MQGDGWPLCYHNVPIKLTCGEASICWALMKSYPDYVSKPALLERLDSEGIGNTIQVMVCRIRAKLDALGLPCPIETVRERGYRWTAECREAIEADLFDCLTVANIRQAFPAPEGEI